MKTDVRNINLTISKYSVSLWLIVFHGWKQAARYTKLSVHLCIIACEAAPPEMVYNRYHHHHPLFEVHTVS